MSCSMSFDIDHYMGDVMVDALCMVDYMVDVAGGLFAWSTAWSMSWSMWLAWSTAWSTACAKWDSHQCGSTVLLEYRMPDSQGRPLEHFQDPFWHIHGPLEHF